MLRRQRSELVVSPQPGGVVVQGSPGLVRALAERVREIARSVDVERIGAMLTTAATAIDQLASEGGAEAQYFEFSPRAIDLLKQHGAIPTGEGFFRSMVHDGAQLAGNLDWKPINASADLLQLQTVAVGLVLQASIAELADSVQRVEEKLEHLLDTVWADKVGEVVAHHRVLDELVGSSNEGHRLSHTDWSTIEHLRTEIGRNIDSIRVLLRLSMSRAEAGRTASSRAGAAKRLLDADFVEGLALLAVCEHNLASWHHLRVQRVRESEPVHLDRTLGARRERPRGSSARGPAAHRRPHDLRRPSRPAPRPRRAGALEAKSAGVEHRGHPQGDRPLRHPAHARHPRRWHRGAADAAGEPERRQGLECRSVEGHLPIRAAAGIVR